MSYVESFDTEMELARLDCNALFLDRLQAAHDAEMKQLSKEEFHRGYESGVAARDAEQWQLDRERAKIIEAVRKVVPEGYFGSDEMLSEICRAIYSPVFGWTAEAGRYLCDRLICLLGGESINKGAETSAKVVQNGEKYQLATYDVLGNERHKVVCELRKLRDRGSVWGRELVVALGLSVEATNDDFCNRLIYLLGGDECNFSGVENYTDADDASTNPAETSNSHSDSVSFGTPSSITDDLRKFAETFRYEWYDEKDGNVCYTTSNMPPTIDSVNGADYINGIADRIDEQFERICSQHESVLQQTISDTVDEHEREMAELRAELEEAQALIADNANDWTAYRIAQSERDSLLDLLRDAREEYKMLDRMSTETNANFHAMRDRVWGLEAERDELKANLDESVTNQVELEEDFNSVRRQWDECEEWCNELLDKLAEYESCDLAQTHRTLRRMLGEVKNLHDTLKAKVDAKPRITEERDKYRKLAKRNEQWCDALLDLIRDAATDYEAEHMECVELRQKLNARDAIIDSYHERMKGLDEAERRMAVAESKCEKLRKRLIMQDYVRGVIDQEEAGRRIERLKDARG